MFERFRRTGRKALVGYLTAGDPDMHTSAGNMEKAVSAGVDILEIGVPFSDPTADGPVIQEAGGRALAAGTDLAAVIGMAAKLREKVSAPFVLFSYANPLLNYGYEKLCVDARKAGIDAILVVDMPFEEQGQLSSVAEKNGLFLIPLIAPTTSEERMEQTLNGRGGFVYYVMVRGVTGQRQALPTDIAAHISAVRRHTRLPIAAGFGISEPEQAAAVAAFADAVVVGSALVRAARNGGLVDLVKGLAEAVKSAGL